MPVAFPTIEPTSRSFTAPRWQVTTNVSQSGVTTRRLWSSRPSRAELVLRFGNVTDAATSDILGAWHAAKGATTDLTLPAILFNGASSTLTNWLNTSSTGAGMKWYFAEEPPTVESIAPGRSNVSVRLIAELQ